jgi:hypothetical protein
MFMAGIGHDPDDRRMRSGDGNAAAPDHSSGPENADLTPINPRGP